MSISCFIASSHLKREGKGLGWSEGKGLGWREGKGPGWSEGKGCDGGEGRANPLKGLQLKVKACLLQQLHLTLQV